MFTVERKIILKHEHSQLCRRVRARLREHRNLGLLSSNGSATHAVAAVSVQAAVAVIGTRGAVHRSAGIAADKRISRITRQYRDVVPLARVQVDVAGHYLSLPGSGSIGPANAIALVADHEVA